MNDVYTMKVSTSSFPVEILFKYFGLDFHWSGFLGLSIRSIRIDLDAHKPVDVLSLGSVHG